MSQQPSLSTRTAEGTKPRFVVPLPRPKWFDCVILLIGFAASLLLTRMSGFHVTVGEETSSWWSTNRLGAVILDQLPNMLFLPVGVLLFWPVFYLSQWIAGRKQGVTVAEWLWLGVWVAAVALATWIIWQFLAPDSLPEFLQPVKFAPHLFLGYVIGMLALGALALVIGIVDIFGRWNRPWSHPLVLALLMWPVGPVLLLLLSKMKMVVGTLPLPFGHP
jgi:hypothetical protein